MDLHVFPIPIPPPRLLDSVGEGEGGMFREKSIEIYILSIVKQITSPGWMHETSARALGALGRPREITPVFLPGKSHGQRRLVGYSPWGCKRSDTTE